MSIKIKTQKETFDIAGGEAHLIFRRPSQTKMLLFTLAYSKNGVMAPQTGAEKVQFVFDAMALFIKDWDGFEDEDTGKNVDYTPDLLDLIPEDDINRFVEEIVNPEMEKCLAGAKSSIKSKIDKKEETPLGN